MNVTVKNESKILEFLFSFKENGFGEMIPSDRKIVFSSKDSDLEFEWSDDWYFSKPIVDEEYILANSEEKYEIEFLKIKWKISLPFTA